MKKYLIYLIFGLIITLIGYLFFEINSPGSPLGEEKIFLIKGGEGVKEIGANLEKEKLVRNQYLFDFYVFLTGKTKKLQAGGYLLSPSMNIVEITKKIVSGDVIKEKITIIEGWNLRDIGFYFENKGMFQAEELWELAAKDFSQDFDFLKDKPKNVGLEGYFFPDTYEILPKISLEDIIKKMLQNFDKKLAPYRLALSGKAGAGAELTIFEVITMASLLEKEVRTLEDKKIVAGILWKRLKNNIPLQVDATIVYILEQQREEKKKTTKISKEETEIESPYNTYKYRGLPLGPICNPGIESIKAAIYPQDSLYWYYLSAPDSKTIFSKTLEEHNFAKAKFLR